MGSQPVRSTMAREGQTVTTVGTPVGCYSDKRRIVRLLLINDRPLDCILDGCASSAWNHMFSRRTDTNPIARPVNLASRLFPYIMEPAKRQRDTFSRLPHSHPDCPMTSSMSLPATIFTMYLRRFFDATLLVSVPILALIGLGIYPPRLWVAW